MDTAMKIIVYSIILQGVWCKGFNISLPEKIEALNGCSVIIKCAFEIEEKYDQDLSETATGVWHKNDTSLTEHVVFNSSSNNHSIKATITGKLKAKDCTTVFYNVDSSHIGKYFFRLEGNGGLKWTYTKTSVSVDVINSPHNPTVKLYVDEKEVQSQQEVLEGSSVCLSCSAETLCSSPPATLTWSSTSRLPFSLQEKQNQNKLISHLKFTATPLQHTATFTCTVTYQLQDNNKTAHSNLTLHVTYAPKISISSSCNRTDVTVCLCEVDGNPSPKLVWHLSGRPVTNSTIMSISEERLSSTVLRSFITLHHSLTHTSTVQCVTTNTHGNDKQLFQWLLYAQDRGINILSVLIGAAVGVLVVMVGLTHQSLLIAVKMAITGQLFLSVNLDNTVGDGGRQQRNVLFNFLVDVILT
ncbi:Schwann cell myelin protein-like [Xyrauchen texanus]|uniref:Schwann cell myelin protein-like n=1 Tax=Xyrauchen texanus TaxID=154827 RepID=UPI002241BCA0|nr:Schwann cell myelin protein-like [Xyrauchen texanus]